MAYTLPTFNLTCNVYTNNGDWLTKVFRSIISCQLRGPQQGPRVGSTLDFGFGGTGAVPLLLLPSGADVRDLSVYPAVSTSADLIEVPAGSGRWYTAWLVDDIAKGFPNEHRFALLSKAYANGNTLHVPPWPIPIP